MLMAYLWQHRIIGEKDWMISDATMWASTQEAMLHQPVRRKGNEYQLVAIHPQTNHTRVIDACNRCGEWTLDSLVTRHFGREAVCEACAAIIREDPQFVSN